MGTTTSARFINELVRNGVRGTGISVARTVIDGHPDPAWTPTGRLYLVRGRANGPVKIGYASNPRRRLQNLQTASPVRLSLIADIPGSRALERWIHDSLWQYRLHGEWFRSTPHDVQGLVAVAIALQAEGH